MGVSNDMKIPYQLKVIISELPLGRNLPETETNRKAVSVQGRDTPDSAV